MCSQREAEVTSRGWEPLHPSGPREGLEWEEPPRGSPFPGEGSAPGPLLEGVRQGAGSQLWGTGPTSEAGAGTLGPSEARGPEARDSRGVGAGLVCAGAIHIQRDLLPFAAAVVGVQGVDGHLKLYLEAPSTPTSHEVSKAQPSGDPRLPHSWPCGKQGTCPTPGPQLPSTPQATNPDCNRKSQSGFREAGEGRAIWSPLPQSSTRPEADS